jgi:hypothetical protein
MLLMCLSEDAQMQHALQLLLQRMPLACNATFPVCSEANSKCSPFADRRCQGALLQFDKLLLKCCNPLLPMMRLPKLETLTVLIS